MQNTTNRAFLYDLGGYLAVGVIIICAIISVFAYVIVPDNSVNANQMHLSIHSQSPGFEVKMISIPSSKDKEISSFYSFLLGNPYPAIQYPISSYEIGDHGILIEHYNFDSLGKESGFPHLLLAHIPQLRKSLISIFQTINSYWEPICLGEMY